MGSDQRREVSRLDALVASSLAGLGPDALASGILSPETGINFGYQHGDPTLGVECSHVPSTISKVTFIDTGSHSNPKVDALFGTGMQSNFDDVLFA
jgi:peptide/nickel transport system substrate-binding protein